MAKDETWAKLKHFRPDSAIDKWGDTREIDDSLLLSLDDFRSYIGCPIYVTAGVKTSGHASTSFHYPEQGGCAADVLIPDFSGNGLDLLLDAGRFGFTGIGYYPDWKWKGKKVGGLHLDKRPLGLDSDGTLNYKQARWMGVEQNGRQLYIPLNYENIKKHGGLYGLS